MSVSSDFVTRPWTLDEFRTRFHGAFTDRLRVRVLQILGLAYRLQYDPPQEAFTSVFAGRLENNDLTYLLIEISEEPGVIETISRAYENLELSGTTTVPVKQCRRIRAQLESCGWVERASVARWEPQVVFRLNPESLVEGVAAVKPAAYRRLDGTPLPVRGSLVCFAHGLRVIDGEDDLRQLVRRSVPKPHTYLAESLLDALRQRDEHVRLLVDQIAQIEARRATLVPEPEKGDANLDAPPSPQAQDARKPFMSGNRFRFLEFDLQESASDEAESRDE